jgi:hypothetical protein
MLAAVINGKAGRVTMEGVDSPVSWRNLFRCTEDLLTAVFFGRVKYLSPEMQQRFLECLLGDTEKAREFGLITADPVEFWPSFQAPSLSHGNTHHVEPDVIIKYEHGWLLIEVKSPNGGQQYAEQWENELRALVTEAEENSKWEVPNRIGFIALGNNSEESIQSVCNGVDTKGHFIVHPNKIEWEEISSFLTGLSDLDSATDKHVVEDWKNAFELYGIGIKPEPLGSYIDLVKELCDDDIALMQRMKTVK